MQTQQLVEIISGIRRSISLDLLKSKSCNTTVVLYYKQKYAMQNVNASNSVMHFWDRHFKKEKAADYKSLVQARADISFHWGDNNGAGRVTNALRSNRICIEKADQMIDRRMFCFVLPC